MAQVTTVGIDLAKQVYSPHGVARAMSPMAVMGPGVIGM